MATNRTPSIGHLTGMLKTVVTFGKMGNGSVNSSFLPLTSISVSAGYSELLIYPSTFCFCAWGEVVISRLFERTGLPYILAVAVPPEFLLAASDALFSSVYLLEVSSS